MTHPIPKYYVFVLTFPVAAFTTILAGFLAVPWFTWLLCAGKISIKVFNFVEIQCSYFLSYKEAIQ